jgi:AraC-like DNA-binding protein
MNPGLHRSDHPPRWLARIRERLDAEFVAPPGLAELAAQAGVSPRHLARAFRSHYGETIGTCVHRRRIRSAMDALLNSSERVAHIAQRSGYFDQSHFTRHFKRQTGVAPGTYRRRALGEGTDGRPAAPGVAGPGPQHAPAVATLRVRALLVMTAAALSLARPPRGVSPNRSGW